MTSLLDQLEGARTALIQAPPLDDQGDLCTSLLTESEASVLFVTYTRTAADCAAQVAHADVKDIGVITVGNTVATDETDVQTEQVSTPNDLTSLGITIGEFLESWDPPVAVCFDSLTTLLQYVSFDTAYEFVHTIAGQIHAAGACIHFHIDPGAHGAQQIAGLTSLVDASIKPDENRVRTREII